VNLFATVLTYPAPSANYRGESELNRAIIQKITDGRFDYPIISPEAMRNALREILAGYGLPMNRERLHDEEQLAVRFKSYPDPGKYADDFLFGYLLAATGKDREKIRGAVSKEKERSGTFAFKRDSILRMNLAKGLEPYRHNAVFTQSPLSAEGSAYQNASTSALLHRETAVTAFQYPFALNLNDCTTTRNERGERETNPTGSSWSRALLKAIGELNSVAGNHARSYFEMAPASIVVRLTDQLVAGYDTYGFRVDRKLNAEEQHRYPEVVDEFLGNAPVLPGREFFIGGKIVKQMSEVVQQGLQQVGVTLDRDPRRLLMTVADKAGLADGRAS
jgi:CRISPR-associated protein Cst2